MLIKENNILFNLISNHSNLIFFSFIIFPLYIYIFYFILYFPYMKNFLHHLK